MKPRGADLCTEPFEQSEPFCKVLPNRRERGGKKKEQRARR